MAVIAPQEVLLGIRGVRLFKWATLTSADTAAGLSLPAYADKTWQITGTYGAATVSLQGSLDDVTYGLLHLYDATDATGLTGNEPLAPLENPLYVKPVTASADGTTALVVWLLCTTPRG